MLCDGLRFMSRKKQGTERQHRTIDRKKVRVPRIRLIEGPSWAQPWLLSSTLRERDLLDAIVF